MTLGAPVALWWLLACVAIAALYLRRRRPRREVVSTVLFWDQAIDTSRPRAWWRRLRHVVSLLVQLLIAVLLVLALAELSWHDHEAQRTVIVIDNSASMAAASRLDEAKRKARDVISGMNDGDRAAIMLGSAPPRVVCGLTSQQRMLRRAIDAIEPAAANDALSEAIAIARDAGDLTIVISDEQALPSATWVRVGDPADNAAITQFAARRSMTDPVGYHILIAARNFADHTVRGKVELTLAGQVLDVVPVQLKPGETWRQTLEKTSENGGNLTVTLLVNDALAIDNTARLTLPPRRPVRVALRGEPNAFIARALDAMPLVQPADEADVTVYHRDVSSPLPHGPALVIDPQRSTDLWRVGDALREPIVAEQDRASPLLAHVNLLNLHIPRARPIEPIAGAHVLAAGPGGEVIAAAFERDAGRVVVIAANVVGGDLPLRTAFPIFMANTLTWLTGGDSEQVYAAAMLDERESDLRMPVAGHDNINVAAVARPTWMYLLTAALAMLAIEWLLNQRRVLV